MIENQLMFKTYVVLCNMGLLDDKEGKPSDPTSIV